MQLRELNISFWIILLVIIAFDSYGQKYNGSAMIKKADSVIIKVVGKKAFGQYYIYDTKSYYEYINWTGKRELGTLQPHKKTKGKFVSMDVRYDFFIKEYNCYGRSAYVHFNNVLDVTHNIDTGLLPKYILHGLPDNIIKDSVVLSSAKTLFRKKGIKPISVNLIFDNLKNRYAWEVKNITDEYKDWKGKDAGVMEVVEYDAFTGESLSYSPDLMFGPVY